MQACDNFLQFNLSSCPDSFVIDAGLNAEAEYVWELKNKFNRKIWADQTTDADGILTIPVAEPLSKDMFHDFSNAYELRLYILDGSDNRVPVVFCNQYDYLVLVFEDSQPAPDPNNALIQIECPS